MTFSANSPNKSNVYENSVFSYIKIFSLFCRFLATPLLLSSKLEECYGQDGQVLVRNDALDAVESERQVM